MSLHTACIRAHRRIDEGPDQNCLMRPALSALREHQIAPRTVDGSRGTREIPRENVFSAHSNDLGHRAALKSGHFPGEEPIESRRFVDSTFTELFMK
jgi:hypothetical protein